MERVGEQGTCAKGHRKIKARTNHWTVFLRIPLFIREHHGLLFFPKFSTQKDYIEKPSELEGTSLMPCGGS